MTSCTFGGDVPILLTPEQAGLFKVKVYLYRYKPRLPSRARRGIQDAPGNIRSAIYVESPYNIHTFQGIRMVARERGGPTDNHVLFVSPRDLIPLENFTGWAWCNGIVGSPHWINNKGHRYWLRSDLPFLKGRRSAPVANLDTNTAEEVAIRDIVWLPDKIPGVYGPYLDRAGPDPDHWITLARGYGGIHGAHPDSVPGNHRCELIPFPGCENRWGRRQQLVEINRVKRAAINDMPCLLTEEPDHANTDNMRRRGPLIICGGEGVFEKEGFRSVVTWIDGENDGMTDWITIEEMNACYIDVIKPSLRDLPPPPVEESDVPVQAAPAEVEDESDEGEGEDEGYNDEERNNNNNINGREVDEVESDESEEEWDESGYYESD